MLHTALLFKLLCKWFIFFNILSLIRASYIYEFPPCRYFQVFSIPRGKGWYLGGLSHNYFRKPRSLIKSKLTLKKKKRKKEKEYVVTFLYNLAPPVQLFLLPQSSGCPLWSTKHAQSTDQYTQMFCSQFCTAANHCP